MKVFISWSGNLSHDVAVALRKFLRQTINVLDPFVSSLDIEKGEGWSANIATELEGSHFGIICLTRENMGRAWLNFEAGAISKATSGGARAATLLVDIQSNAEVTGPLSQFQSTELVKDDVGKLLSALNAHSGGTKTESELQEALDVWWPRLREDVDRALRGQPISLEKEPRTQEDVLDEILSLARSMNKRLSSLDVPTVPTTPKSGDGDASHRRSYSRELEDRLVDQAIKATLGDELSSWGIRRGPDGLTVLLPGWVTTESRREILDNLGPLARSVDFGALAEDSFRQLPGTTAD